MTKRFSNRQGYRPPATKITIREDAPSSLRHAIPLLAKEAGMLPSTMRQVICGVLLIPPDQDNWSEHPNIWDEVVQLIENAQWYKVYDIIEALYTELATSISSWNCESADGFKQNLNDFFAENGIGWELRDSQIMHRGSEAFAKSTHEVPEELKESGYQRAAIEMREALEDISRRPKPDITGAIQHAMAALETTAREISDQPNLTLGKLIPLLDLPEPLNQALHKLWGYASDRGRHIREQQSVDYAEAELIVAVACALCAYLLQRIKPE